MSYGMTPLVSTPAGTVPGSMQNSVSKSDTQTDVVPSIPHADHSETGKSLTDREISPMRIEVSNDHSTALQSILDATQSYQQMHPYTPPAGVSYKDFHCTGRVWVANEQEADKQSDGVIVVAHHLAEWMFQPEFLAKVKAFVVEQVRFDELAAVFLREKEIPLLPDFGYFESLVAQSGQQVTLKGQLPS